MLVCEVSENFHWGCLFQSRFICQYFFTFNISLIWVSLLVVFRCFISYLLLPLNLFFFRLLPPLPNFSIRLLYFLWSCGWYRNLIIDLQSKFGWMVTLQAAGKRGVLDLIRSLGLNGLKVLNLLYNN